jgi:hypothetical protein
MPRCRRPFNTAADMQRWRSEYAEQMPGEVDEPLWAMRLCWTIESTGIVCHSDPRKVQRNIRFAESMEELNHAIRMSGATLGQAGEALRQFSGALSRVEYAGVHEFGARRR